MSDTQHGQCDHRVPRLLVLGILLSVYRTARNQGRSRREAQRAALRYRRSYL